MNGMITLPATDTEYLVQMIKTYVHPEAAVMMPFAQAATVAIDIDLQASMALEESAKTQLRLEEAAKLVNSELDQLPDTFDYWNLLAVKPNGTP